MTSDLGLGVVLTALAYGFLIWAVVHGKHIVDRIARGEEPKFPSDGRGPGADDRPSGEGEAPSDGLGNG